MDGVTQNELLDGRVRLLQPERGYRVGVDAVLLASAARAAPGQRVIEAGCGVGGALIAAAAMSPGAEFVGVERDPAAQTLGRRNIDLNELGDRVTLLEGDVGNPFRDLGLPVFDAAFANPPFFDDAAALRGPSESRRQAWITEAGLSAWLDFLLKAVREGGALTLIHRADRLGDLLAGLGSKAGSIQVRPIHPYADQPAKRVLVRAVKTGKAPLQILPPLVLHDTGGEKFRPEVEAILRGQATLGWR